MLYQAIHWTRCKFEPAFHWTRSKFEPAFQVKETRIFGSKRAAELWARSVLEPVVTTRDNYHRDVGRADSVDVTPVVHFMSEHMYRLGLPKEYRQCGQKHTIEPDVHIVPSVGELGYW